MEITSRGFRLHADVTGDGPTVVLVSGHLQAAEDWLDAGYGRLLGDAFRLVALDPLGYGKSDKPTSAEAYSLAGSATDLLTLLDRLEVERAVIWGYSRGATLVESFARGHPSRLRGVVLGGNLAGLDSEDRRNLFSPMAEAHRTLDWERFFAEAFPHFPADVRPQVAARNVPAAAAAAWEGLFLPDPFAGKPIESPTLAYIGSGEWFWEAVRDWAEGNGADFSVVTGRDHGGAFRAADEVVPLVRPFLQKHAGD